MPRSIRGAIEGLVVSSLIVLGLACAGQPPPPVSPPYVESRYEQLWHATINSRDESAVATLIAENGSGYELTHDELYEYAYDNILIVGQWDDVEHSGYYTLSRFSPDKVRVQGRWHSSLDEKVELTKTWWKVDGHLATPAYGGNEPRFLIRVFQNPTTGEFLVWEVNLRVPMAAGVSVQPSQAFIRQLWDG